MEVEWQENQKGGTSAPGSVEEIWKMCWQLNVPNAVKMFVWKAGHNLLPTKANLLRRGVIKEAMCPICSRETETTKHILWECSSTNDVWGCGPVRLQKSSCKGGTFLNLLEEVRVRCDRREVELFAITARRIWLRRNDIVHGGGFTHPTQVFTEAVKALDDFQRVNGSQKDEDGAGQIHSAVCWKPPATNMVKINWDAALDLRNQLVGIGVVARDEAGSFLGASSWKKHLSVDR
jgi:hypothetical protein